MNHKRSREPRPAQRSRPGALAIHLGLAILTLVFVLTGLTNVERFDSWMQEDHWVEWATFWIFSAAGLIALSSAIASRKDRFLDQFPLLGLAAFCFFVACEEISWAQRLLGIRPPDRFLLANFQQEINIHNIAMTVVKPKWVIVAICIAYGLLLPLTRWILEKRESRFAGLVEAIAPSPILASWFGLVALAEIVYPMRLSGEAAELVLGATFLADVTQRTNKTSRAVARTFSMTGTTVLLLALITQPLLEGTVYRPHPLDLARARAELLMVQAAIMNDGALRPAKLRGIAVFHQRLFTASLDGRIDLRSSGSSFGVGSSDEGRARFMLDPWNNAYWIYGDMRVGLVVVYSVGPNRRRDSDASEIAIPSAGSRLPSPAILPGGDDIGIIVDLKRVRRRGSDQ